MKKIFYIGLVIVLLLLLLGGGALWYLHSAAPEYERDVAITGLSAPVEIEWDALGVPHIRADNEPDLFRALGYVHAQDRLWQMEIFRRVADGRMAEIFGPELVETDRFLRTLGLGRVAAKAETTLDDASRRLLQAYAGGVNAWMVGHDGALPPEFEILRFEPEPWTVRNSLSIAKIMAWDLASWQLGLDLQRAIDVVGEDLARMLFPDYPAWGPTILSLDTLPRIPPLAARLLETVSITRASNAWVIGGSRTRSGKPILANDPHLALRAPSLWYLAALQGGEIAAAGATIPGAPGVILGHTPGVAWGFTNAMVDDVDFFVERVNPDDSTRYLTPNGWRSFMVRPETIRVAGAEPVVHVVRATRHGPVFSDVEERAGDRVLAMRWTAYDGPATTFRAVAAMNRAVNVEELVEAMRGLTVVHQSVIFADTSGDFGYWMSGRVPVRKSGIGLLPVPGWTGEHDWGRYLEFDEHPHVLNPSQGFIVTANNRPVGPDYPFYIGSNFGAPYRAVRIREMITGGEDFTAADVARQQMDVRDVFAADYVAHAVRAAERAGSEEAARLLRAWDTRAHMDSRAAALFYTWYEALRRRVGADEYRGAPMYFPRSALNRLLNTGAGAWVDNIETQETETLEELSKAAMREAIRTVGENSWEEIHYTLMAHPLGRVDALDWLFGFNIGPFPNRGSPYTVNVAGFNGSETPFINTHGPSFRHVVDLADPDGTGGFVLPTGQSGIPFTEHYDDQMPMWLAGELWRIPLNPTAAADPEARMTLLSDE